MSEAIPLFPEARWGDSLVTFSPEVPIPTEGIAAVVVFAIHPDGFVLADIPGRGWCVPSGRPEPGESPLDTAIRETAEEIGAELMDPRPVGVYTLKDGGGVRFVPAFLGTVKELGPLPAGSESRGVRIATMEELPSIYWLWDALMARMFAYAESISRYENERK
jgi:8-oxo-dGTP pyrophosphatase MutT (NUDIX family)